MMSTRATTIDRLLSVCRSHLGKYPPKTGTTGNEAVSVFAPEGAILHSLQSLDFWPIPSDSTSVSKSLSALKPISLAAFQITLDRSSARDNHIHEVIESLRQDLIRVFQEIPSPVQESHIRHIRVQSKK
jgi:hypothetical protein